MAAGAGCYSLSGEGVRDGGRRLVLAHLIRLQAGDDNAFAAGRNQQRNIVGGSAPVPS